MQEQFEDKKWVSEVDETIMSKRKQTKRQSMAYKNNTTQKIKD